MTKIIKNQLETPVAFFIYRRPSLTEKSFEAIRKVRPKKLYLIADGPKGEFEQEKCELARKVVENVDWPCEVKKNYSDINLGLRRRIVSGLNWVFEQEPEAIILEDDVVADSSFFYFCQELLEKYRDDERMFEIVGSNFQVYNHDFKVDASYYFSRIASAFGWATWRRAWIKYDVNMTDWPEFKKVKGCHKLISDVKLATIVTNFFDAVYYRINQNDADFQEWAYQASFAAAFNNMLIIRSKNNLIDNIGFDIDGTNVTKKNKFKHEIDVIPVDFPIIHPANFKVYENADNFIIKFLDPHNV